MSAENEFVKEALEHLYSGRWEEYGGGLGSHLVVDGVGMLIYYGDDSSVKFYAGAASGLTLTHQLCDQVAAINIGTHTGSFFLSRIADSEQWNLIYIAKLFKSWIEPDSGVSAQILLDVLANIPGFVNRAVQYLDQNVDLPVVRWDTAFEQWWFLLMQHT